jgi:nicotinamidase-related amidase
MPPPTPDALAQILGQGAKKPVTYNALVIIGAQDDLIQECSPGEKDEASDFFSKILPLVTKWRDRAGYVVWIRLTGPQKQNNLPKDVQGIQTFFGTSGPPIKKSKDASAYSERVKNLIDAKNDIQLDIPDGSRNITQGFLDFLQMQFIEGVYLCGCFTDAVAFRIMSDAGRTGCDISIIEDCIGYPEKESHDKMMQFLMQQLVAECITSKDINEDLDAPRELTTTTEELGENIASLLANITPRSPKSPSATLPPPPKEGKRRKSNAAKVQTRESQRVKEKAQQRKRVQDLLLDPYAEPDPSFFDTELTVPPKPTIAVASIPSSSATTPRIVDSPISNISPAPASPSEMPKSKTSLFSKFKNRTRSSEGDKKK